MTSAFFFSPAASCARRGSASIDTRPVASTDDSSSSPATFTSALFTCSCVFENPLLIPRDSFAYIRACSIENFICPKVVGLAMIPANTRLDTDADFMRV